MGYRLQVNFLGDEEKVHTAGLEIQAWVPDQICTKQQERKKSVNQQYFDVSRVTVQK